MKITISSDQFGIDNLETFYSSRQTMERIPLKVEYENAIRAEYPEAIIEFYESEASTYGIRIEWYCPSINKIDAQKTHLDIQKISERVFETGLFWI